MKFLIRSLLVLAVAAIFGLVLYYAVQALPNDSPNPRPNANLQPQNGNNAAENPAPRPERSENDRGGGGIGLRFFFGLARRILVFSAMIFFAVLGKNYIFERKVFGKKTQD
ncbi:MAG: hypothetical protein ACM3Y8_04240 [Byssovorax cruenta]